MAALLRNRFHRAKASGPKQLNMPTAWVVGRSFAAVRIKLAEIAVPTGSAVVGKNWRPAPGTTDSLLRGAYGYRTRGGPSRAALEGLHSIIADGKLS
jgi:hypothetical protein